ncbi:MAG: transcriptional regulator, TetR family [Firmicutes bacterium]|nr:transcriptional regulator, TetR family [Bacillota bacterium]MBP2657420.1 transcriptional regulator, TetR family [Bacillota bacterium]
MRNKPLNDTIDTKQKILQAAAQIINEKGILSLTLEAVAKRAGISKGGLLYHFSSKDALMEGMNNFLLQGYINKVECLTNQDSHLKGKWTRAYVTETFRQLDQEASMNAAFLSAAATNPMLFNSMIDRLQKLHNNIEDDNINPVAATVIRLAADGLYYNHLYGINVTKDMREKVLAFLISLTLEDTK